MKTLSDIQERAEMHQVELDSIEGNQQAQEEAVKEKLFALYADCKEIAAVERKLENFDGGSYDLDECGELIYTVEVPSAIADFPMINDYLTRDYAFIHPHYGPNDLRIGQTCGGYIAINWSASRFKDYFVYEREGKTKELISMEEMEEVQDNMQIDYIRAKIELHMRKNGYFPDVVEVDYHGQYVKHFDLSWPGRGPSLDEITNEELETIAQKCLITEEE